MSAPETETQADPGGCCTDCSQVSCDERCIEAIAEIECRLSCGPDGMAKEEKVDQCVSACCTADEGSKANPNLNSDAQVMIPSLCEDICCHDKKTDDCCSEEECGDDKKGSACCVNEDAVCSSDGQKKCCVRREVECLGLEEVDCCSDTKADRCTNKDQGCCPANQASISTGGCDEDYCPDKLDQSTPKVVDSCCTVREVFKPDCEKKNCCADDSTSMASTHPSDAYWDQRHATKGACIGHLQKAFDEYTAYIEKGRCICRDVLNRYRLNACCNKATEDAHRNEKPSAYHVSGVSVGKKSCSRRRVPSRRVAHSSCRTEQQTLAKSTAIETSSACCVNEMEITSPPILKRTTGSHKTIDIEDDAARQHVVLSVTGMTCSGCGRKMENVLKRVEGITSFQVTFVSGIAEFDLDTKVATAEKVIRQVEKETGFKCSLTISDYQILDVLLDNVSAERLENWSCKGIDLVEKIGKGTYRINYNPTTIGARTILSRFRNARLAPPANDTSVADGKKRLTAMAWGTVLATILTVPILVLAWSDNPVQETTRLIVSLVLATMVQCIAIPEFYMGALKALIYSRVMETDMLVTISITAAYGYSVVASALTFAGHSLEVEAFFETSALLITLVLFGRLMVAIARVKAVSAVSVRSLQVEKAVLVQSSGDTEEIDARLLQLGDSFLVRPHTRIVTDGEITNGLSSIDESMVTGESMPVTKTIGNDVIAGTINGPGSLTVRLTRLPGKNSITDIAGLVENALGAKPRVQDLADKFATWFIPIVLCVTTVVFVIWLVVCLKLRKENGGGAFGTAITYAIAVLAITCPCAVGLAVPMVLVIAGGVAARSGVIVKQADALERAYKVSDVVFDKTGTLTNADLNCFSEYLFPDGTISSEKILAITKSVTKDSDHPVSRAVNSAIQIRSSVALDLHDVRSIPGCGVECMWKGMPIRMGNPFWLGVEQHPRIAPRLGEGLTLLCLASGSQPLAIWGLKATVRAEASQVVRSLRQRDIKVHIVSGDAPKVVRNLASELQISLDNIAACQSPAEKQKYVKHLMEQGKTVLFCGDGTNDAVAVAQATIGVQIGSTSDVTRATADVVLLGGLDGIPVLLRLSKQVLRRIQFNFAWSTIYNIFAILLASGAFVKVRIPPAYAGLGEIVSISPVIVAAVTLLMVKRSV